MATSRILSAAVSLLLLFVSTHSLAGASFGMSTDIPRAYGPFKLGMSAAEFTRLTGIVPETCSVCLEEETYSALSPALIQKFIPQHQNREGVDFFFLNNELYLISRTPDVSGLNVVADEVTQSLGMQGNVRTQPNGVSVMKWEDPTTLVYLNFNQANNEVFSINIQDYNLSQEKAWRESILVEQTANLAP